MAGASQVSISPTAFASLVGHLDRTLSASPYYPCILLVHPEIARLQAATGQLVEHYGWATLSVGAVVSQALLQVMEKRRPQETRRALHQGLQPFIPGPVLCTDIDLLCEPSLMLDPLRLLRDASRRVPLVVSWPGSVAGGALAYAVPEHAHYRTWSQTDLDEGCIMPL